MGLYSTTGTLEHIKRETKGIYNGDTMGYTMVCSTTLGKYSYSDIYMWKTQYIYIYNFNYIFRGTECTIYYVPIPMYEIVFENQNAKIQLLQ